MRLQSAALAALFLATLGGLAACGSDSPTKPTTPVTLKFRTPVFPNQEGTSRDTVKGTLTIDDTLTVNLPYDTIANFPRGEHRFVAHLDIDYLPASFTAKIDPSRSTYTLDVGSEPTCRVWQLGSLLVDRYVCRPIGQPWRNLLYNSQYRRLYCPAGDFGEFCTPEPDEAFLGLTWPADSATGIRNEYVSRGKLLVAATVGPELTLNDADRTIAMALYRPGDYSPRRRLQVVAGDSTRYGNTVWTDVRHVPVYPYPTGQLALSDRPNGLFGLEVKVTYLLPQADPNTLVVRYDVTNVSDQPDYRRVHPQVPAGGFTLSNVYLTPMLDPDVGGFSDASDDAATVFPAEGIVMAYDRNFSVTAWSAPYNAAPGIVGFKVLSTDAGPLKAVSFTADSLLDWDTRAHEAQAYGVLTAGRAGAAVSGCTSLSAIYLCGAPEGSDDVRIGWSAGPIASLAPGQTRSITVALALATPVAGTFTSGTALPPQNGSDAQVSSTSKPSYLMAANLRARMNAISTTPVTPAP